MKTQRKIALFTVFALTLVWTIAPAAIADPVKKPTAQPQEIKTDKDTDKEDADLPEV